MTNIQAADLLKGLEQCLDDYCELNDEGKTAFRMAITALESFGISEQLPSAQPEYEPVTAEDFAKTMSENTLYGFMAWHGEALTLMKEQGFVICEKTM